MNRKIKWILVCILTVAPALLAAQDSQEVTIPLSNPGQQGTLQVNLITGTIDVATHNRNDVLLTYSSAGGSFMDIGGIVVDAMANLFSQDNNQNSEDSTEISREGLTRIPNSSRGIEATERSNVVTVDVPPMGGAMNLTIYVPENFSLKLSNVNGGDITVDGVDGEHEISSVNGRITMTGISGGVIANTVNGAMVIRFDDVDETAPMSFTTVNGDIDLGLPANTEFSVKINSEFGEILTDFDMDLNPRGVNTETSQNSGTYQVNVNRWVTGSINGGGPEYVFRSLNGDVIIRQHNP